MLRRVAEICIRLKGKDRIGSRDVYDAEHGYVTCLQKRSDCRNGGSPAALQLQDCQRTCSLHLQPRAQWIARIQGMNSGSEAQSQDRKGDMELLERVVYIAARHSSEHPVT